MFFYFNEIVYVRKVPLIATTRMRSVPFHSSLANLIIGSNFGK